MMINNVNLANREYFRTLCHKLDAVIKLPVSQVPSFVKQINESMVTEVDTLM